MGFATYNFVCHVPCLLNTLNIGRALSLPVQEDTVCGVWMRDTHSHSLCQGKRFANEAEGGCLCKWPSRAQGSPVAKSRAKHCVVPPL